MIDKMNDKIDKEVENSRVNHISKTFKSSVVPYTINIRHDPSLDLDHSQNIFSKKP